MWIAVQVTSRTPILQRALIEALNEKLDADVELQSFEVRTFPVVRIHGEGLRLRVKGQKQPVPFIQVERFDVAGGLFGMLRRQRRFARVELHGLRITIPPRSEHDREAGTRAAEAVGGPVIIDEVLADNAQLVIVPKDPAKEARIFDIHHLRLTSVGFHRAMPFKADLTNPIPVGEIETTGTFGPWVSADPGSSPLNGRYVFNHADLSTIHGISGILDSSGDFDGQLAEIDVKGTTTTADFRLDSADQPVPLDTRFHVVVDGTTGNTFLKEVDAKLQDTEITATGEVVRTPSVKGRTVRLDARIRDGRVQDVLHLAVKSRQPVMLGRIALESTIVIPPGKEKVADRLQLRGRFALEQAKFTDHGVQEQLAALSRRSQGKKPDDPIPPIHSAMAGRFVMKGGVITLRRSGVRPARRQRPARRTLRDPVRTARFQRHARHAGLGLEGRGRDQGLLPQAVRSALQEGRQGRPRADHHQGCASRFPSSA